MCFFGGNDTPVPKPPPPPAAAPVEQEQAVQESMDRERRRQAAAMGQRSTILTGAMGVAEPATTTKKTLLGA